jgi:predicted N-formylglutamate amidohydrolase
VSCEHGGNRVPAEWATSFLGHDDLLQSHRGWDPGALELAHHIARRLRAPLFAAETTRLLVDLNRSADHPEVFSELTGALPPEERETLLARHYFPYRHGVETAVAAAVAGGATVVHLSVHTFTPMWEGRARKVDVGLLFDPGRDPEAAFCGRLRAGVEARLPTLRVRDNEPYLGVADGFTSYLRRRFPAVGYLGVEIEMSSGLTAGADDRDELRGEIANAVADTLDLLCQERQRSA